jgi:trans-aconitate methyltransferase
MYNNFNTIIKRIVKNLISLLSAFNKLSLLNKIFIILLILVFAYLILDKHTNLENFEDLTFNKKFENKIDNKVFDDFYAKYYDNIHLNKEKNKYQIDSITKFVKKHDKTKLLDIGCGTGYHVNLLTKLKYDITGLDQSEAMIAKAKQKYPDSEFIKGDILINNAFDYNSYTDIICLNMTIYFIQNKDLFFENCYGLLASGGKLFVHLVNREKFKPYVMPDDDTVLYNPEKYKKDITQTIVKFDNDNEYISEYELIKNKEQKNDNENENDSGTTDSSIPYSVYKEKFENFNTHNVRKNEINMYMPPVQTIIDIAKRKGFKQFGKINLAPVNHNHEYIYIFIK